MAMALQAALGLSVRALLLLSVFHAASGTVSFADGAVVVRIESVPGQDLNLAEVTAFTPAGVQLVATAAYLDDHWGDKPAQLCVDGIVDERYNFCAANGHTGPLELEYPPGTSVGRVEVVNRIDYGHITSRIVGATIQLKRVPWVVWEGGFPEDKEVYNFTVLTTTTTETATGIADAAAGTTQTTTAGTTQTTITEASSETTVDQAGISSGTLAGTTLRVGGETTSPVWSSETTSMAIVTTTSAVGATTSTAAAVAATTQPAFTTVGGDASPTAEASSTGTSLPTTVTEASSSLTRTMVATSTSVPPTDTWQVSTLAAAHGSTSAAAADDTSAVATGASTTSWPSSTSSSTGNGNDAFTSVVQAASVTTTLLATKSTVVSADATHTATLTTTTAADATGTTSTTLTTALTAAATSSSTARTSPASSETLTTVTPDAESTSNKPTTAVESRSIMPPSSTSNAPTWQPHWPELLASAEALTQQLLAGLGTNNTAVASAPGATAAVVRLPHSSDEARTSVALPELGVTVGFPRRLLEELMSNGEELFLAAATFPLGANTGGVLAAAELSLRRAWGDALAVRGLVEPVHFSLQAPAAATCAFWQPGNGWTSEGVYAREGAPEGEVWCGTRHFSLFGAVLQGFVNTLLCAQFRLFNAEAAANMLRGVWFQQAGSLILWPVLAALLLAMAAAAVLDAQRGCAKMDERFMLLPRICGPSPRSVPELEQMAEEWHHAESLRSSQRSSQSSQGAPGRCGGHLAAAMGCCCVAGGYCRETGLRDALDEVASEWFEQFSELRSLLEEVWSDMDVVAAGSSGRIFHISHVTMMRLVITCSQRLTAGSLGLKLEAVNFVLRDSDLKSLLSDGHEEVREEELHGAQAWWGCGRSEEAWVLLHKDVCDCVQRQVPRFTWCRLGAIVLRLFLVQSPWAGIFTRDVFASCKLRVLFQGMETLGTLLVVSAFFAASGTVKGRPSSGGEDAACGEEGGDADGIPHKVGRAFAVAMGSVLLAALPVSFLRSLHVRRLRRFEAEGCEQWKRQLRSWRAAGACVWALGLFYSVGAAAFVTLFLANIDEDAHEDWATTALLTLAWDSLIVPFLLSLVLPALALTLLSLNEGLGGVRRSYLVRDIQLRLISTTNVMLPITKI